MDGVALGYVFFHLRAGFALGREGWDSLAQTEAGRTRNLISERPILPARLVFREDRTGSRIAGIRFTVRARRKLVCVIRRRTKRRKEWFGDAPVVCKYPVPGPPLW